MNRILHSTLNLWNLMCIAGAAISLMVVDELMMALAYEGQPFATTSYCIPFMGCHGIWVVWGAAFIVLLAIVLVLALEVAVLLHRR